MVNVTKIASPFKDAVTPVAGGEVKGNLGAKLTGQQATDSGMSQTQGTIDVSSLPENLSDILNGAK
jgi:hypothetical protein